MDYHDQSGDPKRARFSLSQETVTVLTVGLAFAGLLLAHLESCAPIAQTGSHGERHACRGACLPGSVRAADHSTRRAARNPERPGRRSSESHPLAGELSCGCPPRGVFCAHPARGTVTPSPANTERFIPTVNSASPRGACVLGEPVGTGSVSTDRVGEALPRPPH